MTINCKGKLIDLSCPKVMGILNLTPDSFYDGGKYKNDKSILHQVDKMLSEGATFIDVGAYSSRPGADHISVEEEKARLLPILSLLQKTYGDEILISVDTFRSEVAKDALHYYAALINDISAGKLDPKMFDVVAEYQVPYIMMHMKGTPQNMKLHTHYNNLIADIKTYFSEQIHEAVTKGIHDIIIDPGFGFAKTLDQNFHLLKNLSTLNTLGKPILCGLSRKSMVYKPLNTTSKEALNGSTALHSLALLNGAKILRVHDVKEAIECINLYNLYMKK
jgi:dihydropteroate synthase